MGAGSPYDIFGGVVLYTNYQHCAISKMWKKVLKLPES